MKESERDWITIIAAPPGGNATGQINDRLLVVAHWLLLAQLLEMVALVLGEAA